MSNITDRPAPTILCVDDLADNLAIRKLMLETFGYKVLTATTPTEALQVLDANRAVIELVLLDYSFPNCEENGEWLAREIRRRSEEIKTIMLSGYPEVPSSATESVDMFWTKGSDPTELRRAIEALLKVERLRAVPVNDVQSRNVELRKQSEELLRELNNRRIRRG